MLTKSGDADDNNDARYSEKSGVQLAKAGYTEL